MTRGVRHSVRKLLLLGAVGLTAVAVVPSTAAPSARERSVALSPLEAGVLRELNAIRTAHGLVPLRVNARLTDAAGEHSREMTAKGYFAHESADGSPFWRRVERYYAPGGAAYWSVGENLLWSAPDMDAKRALDLWMASLHHRENILAPRWREIGIAAVHAHAAPGAFRGLDVTVVTTDFGVRR
jgi:uncharacterized protein YkwD